MSFRDRLRAGEHPDVLLSASVVGDLNADERRRLDEHLAGCPRCRQTASAFAEERRLVSGLRQVAPPRDLRARVTAGIEAGRGAPAPWWRRPTTLVPAGATLATVAAAVLAVLIVSELPGPPVASTDEPSPSASLAVSLTPLASEAPSPAESAAPSSEPMVALEPGELGYLSLEGEPFAPSRLYFINDATGHAVEAEAPSGPPRSAAISPTGEWLAYITEVGQAGANQVWVLHLADGDTQVLGCSAPHPFTERLAWSDDGRFLAYTLAEMDLGSGVDCGGSSGDGTRTNVWLFDAAASGSHVRLTDAGNAFTGDFLQSLDEDGAYRLMVSYAGADPYTEELRIPEASAAERRRLDGAFLPLVSPNGFRSLLWRGEMAQDADGSWRFVRGGMPHVTDEVDVDQGQPLFTDLQTVGGAGFEVGHFAWGDDSDLLAFWGGAWTGAPQDPGGDHPAVDDVYVGRLSEGLLSGAKRLPLDVGEDGRIIAVALGPDGVSATVTVGLLTAGVGDPPSAILYRVPFDGGEPTAVGDGFGAPPWNGPGLYGEEPVELPR